MKKLCVFLFFTLVSCNDALDDRIVVAEWQKKVNENLVTLQRLQRENVELAQKAIEDPNREFIRDISRKLRDHKGSQSALAEEEEHKLLELRQKAIAEKSKAESIQIQITDLILDQFAITLSASKKCNFYRHFRNIADIISKLPIVQMNEHEFWQMKWYYDKQLPNMGFTSDSCKTFASLSSNWLKTTDTLKDQQLRQLNDILKELHKLKRDV